MLMERTACVMAVEVLLPCRKVVEGDGGMETTQETIWRVLNSNGIEVQFR